MQRHDPSAHARRRGREAQVVAEVVPDPPLAPVPHLRQKRRTRGTYYVPSETLLEVSQPAELISQPRAVTGTVRAVTGTALPQDIIDELAKLKRRSTPQKMKDLILRLCEVRPMSREELMRYLKRGGTTIDTYTSEMINKELDYLYPMMVHHPRQAYVAKVEV